MAEITKVALKVDNNSSFPNNNAGAITPSILRAFNTNMIDSLVDEIGYTADSSSWNQQIDSLEQFTASLSTAFVSTGSFNTYTASIDTKFIAVGSSTSSLNSFSASQITKDSTLATYTASVDTKFTAVGVSTSSLNTFSGSQITKNSTLATYTASVDTKFTAVGVSTSSLNTATASLFTSASLSLTTASFSGNTLTFRKGNGTTFGIVLPDVSGSTVPAGTISGSAQITSLGFVSSSVTASSLVTASVNVNVITFTKGDSSTFSLTVTATGSVATGTVSGSAQIVALGFLQTSSFQTYTGSEDTKNIAVGASTSSLNSFTQSAQISINSLNSATSSYVTESETGSFATTGSNTFIGNQTITGNITAFSASFTYLQTIFESSSVIYSSGSNQFGDELSDIQTLSGSVKVQGSLTVNGTPVQTSSVSITALNSFTASQYVSNSFFATTGSNTFTGSQIINAGGQGDPGLTISGSINTLGNLNVYGVTNLISGSSTSIRGNSFNVQDAGGATKFTVSIGAGVIQSQLPLQILAPLTASLQEGYAWVGGAGNISTLVATSSFAGATINTGSLLTTASFNAYTSSNDQKVNSLIAATGSYATTGSNTFVGNQTISSSLFISGNINMVNGADLVTHHVRAAGSNGLELQNASSGIIVSMGAGGGTQASFTGAVTANSISASTITGIGNVTDYSASVDNRLDSLEAATSSYATSAITASSLVTASFSGNTLTFTKGDASTFGVIITGISGSTIDTGSFATTGSNTFTGDQTLTDASGNTVTLTDGSGSLILVAKSYTSASTHLSSSVNEVNLIFKNNSNTADTIISGSGNIFINPAAPTAGFKRYVGGSGNIALNGSNVAQISSSMAFSPTMNNNYFGGNSLGLIMRGPVSSSAWTISGNNALGTINIGGSATANAEKLTSGLTMTGNSVGGTLTIVANQNFLTGSTTAFTNNIIAGVTQVDVSSSAVSVNNNIINDSGFLLTNQFYSSSVGLGLVSLNRNTIGGQTNRITISGSLPSGTTTATSLSDNFIFGGSNTIRVDVANARVSGSTAYINALRTGLMGNQLIVSGSSLLSDNSSYGSVFVGRYNADDSIRNKTSDIVFAVGTGNTTTRKTGLLIDTGSNTFVEGTLNVSGATSLNGNLVITGSLTASLQQGYVYVGDSTGKTTTVATSSFITAPTDISALNSFTSSQQLLNTTFATTGSNSFVGNQIITGNVTISGSATTDLTVVGQIFVSSSATGTTTRPQITVSGSTGQTRILGTQVDARNTKNQSGFTTSTVFSNDLTTTDEIGWAINASSSLLSPWDQGAGIYVNNDPLDSYNVVFGFQNKANYTDGRVAVLTPLSASAGFTASLQNGYAWVGNSLGQNTQVATSSFAGATINTGSFVTTSSFNAYTQSNDSKVNSLINATASYATTGSNTFVGTQIITAGNSLSTNRIIDNGTDITIDGGMNGVIITSAGGKKTIISTPTEITGAVNITGSLTASLQNGYVWVGDASGKTTTVATSSFGGTLPTGTISGSQQITALGFVSSSVTASSLVTASVAGNVLTFTKGDATTFTLTVATGSGGGGAAFPYTGDAVITGSLGISGSMFGGVIPITVVSSTASIDFSKGNMFTLTLPSASTHIVPTNIRAGQTCNIQITQPTPGTGSVVFSPLVLFAGGADYQATQTGSAVDMLTLVSFNGTNTIAAALKNLS